MKKRMTKMMALLGATVMMTGMLTGCGNQTTETTTQNDTAEAPQAEGSAETVTEEVAEEVAETAEETSDLSGSITMAGSTSMEKLANAVAEVFMEKYPNVTVNAEFTGSSAGVESLLAGSVQIGNSSRNLKDTEIKAGAVENIVAIDGIAILTDPANAASNLTKDDLIKIYKGEVKNWSEVGGEDSAIVVIGREAGSGTRGAFEEILDIVEKCSYASELDSTGAVMAKIASTPGAIGYVSLDVIDDSVKALTIDGVQASEAEIKAGNYLLSRPFVMATVGEISEQEDAVKEMFAFLQSEEGKELIKTVGLVTVD